MNPSPYPYVDEFFNTGEETPCIFTLEDESVIECLCHFENEFAAQTAEDIRFEGTNPVALYREIDVINVKQNTKALVKNKNFKVKERHPDGEGMVFMVLMYD